MTDTRICGFFYSVFRRGLHHDMRGLSNYCLCCCVNTLLQTLSATWEVGDVLERWDAAGVREDGGNVPLKLKRVLAAMKSDRPQHVPHKDFLHCLDRNCVRLNVQHDADEVFLSILNLMQQQMDDKALALEIKDLYTISVETHLQCLNCTSVQTLTSYLLSLPLHIKEDHHNSLEDCISSFLAEQELTGINCCFCAQCGTKTQSKQGLKLLSLPRILCVHLKRFRNSRGFTRKLNHRVAFPETFDFSEIVKEGFSPDFAQNECTYTLYAVVVHSGSAVFGHYTAYVRDRANQSWHYADDSVIERASWQEVQQTFGGDHRYLLNDKKIDITHTAYMLMYRRGPKEERQQPELSG